MFVRIETQIILLRPIFKELRWQNMKLLHQSESGKQQQIFGTADVLCMSTENIYPNSVELFDFV